MYHSLVTKVGILALLAYTEPFLAFIIAQYCRLSILSFGLNLETIKAEAEYLGYNRQRLSQRKFPS